MTKEKKKGFFAKLFGGSGGCCCCNVHIKEVKDNEPEKKPQDEKNSKEKSKPDAETQG